MLNKNASLFLAITSWLSCLILIVFRLIEIFNSHGTTFSVYSWINLFVIIIVYIFLGLFGWFSYKNQEHTRSRISIVLAILSGIWITLRFYEFYEYPSIFSHLEELEGFLQFIKFGVIQLLLPLAILLLGIAFAGKKLRRRKRALYWLLLGGFSYLLSDLSYLFFTIYASSSMPEGPSGFSILYIALNLFTVSFSVAVMYFSLKAHASLSELEEVPSEENEDTLDRIEPVRNWKENTGLSVPTPMNWLGSFLLAAIPLAGPILLAVWGSDHQNRIRRNWAIMQFWAVTVGLGLNLILLGAVVGFFEDFPLGLAVMVGLLLTMIVVASVITYNCSQQLSDFDRDQHPSLGTWLANFVIVGIPIVGLIMLIVWATDSTKELIRKWAIARLIWIAVSLMIWTYAYTLYLQIGHIVPFSYFQF
jgi:hypothetical protein